MLPTSATFHYNSKPTSVQYDFTVIAAGSNEGQVEDIHT
jgi:hypothetical protein